MATKAPARRRANVASIVVTAALVLGVILTIRVPALGYGIVAAIGATLLPGYLAVVVFRARRETQQAQRVTLAMLIAFPLAATAAMFALLGWQTGAATAVTAAVLLYVMVGRAYGGNLARVRAVAALRRALAANDEAAIARGIARARTWRSAVAFQVVAALAEHARVAEAEVVARAVPRTPGLQLDRAAWLVGFALARDDAAEARRIVDELDPASVPEAQAVVIDLLAARVRIAEGKANEVARELAAAPEVELAAPIADMRDLVRADARAAQGDRNGAAMLLREVTARGRQTLVALARTRRPLAPIAADLAKKQARA